MAMGRGRPVAGVTKESIKKTMNKQDRKDLKTLANDFWLLHRADVQEIIANCTSYAEGRQKILRVYTAVYMR